MPDSVSSDRRYDCIVCGSCTVDILVTGIDLHQPIGIDQLHRVDPIELAVGGIVSNAGITMSRLGMRAAGFSATGDDDWGRAIRAAYQADSVDASQISCRSDFPTSTTVVMVDRDGNRSFVHSQGAPKAMTAADYLAALPVFAQSRAMLLGYYPLFPKMISELADVMQAIRGTGCLTAMDSAGGGGTMEPLRSVLPHVDVYCPSLQEAAQQTGVSDPAEILKIYRGCGAPGVLGVKLGTKGAVLSPSEGELVHISPISPPGPVVDTTGAGDAFFAGLMSGLLSGYTIDHAGRIAAATGALSTTKRGATAAASSLTNALNLAGLGLGDRDPMVGGGPEC